MHRVRAICVTAFLLGTAVALWPQAPAVQDDTAAQLRALMTELKQTRADLESYRSEVQQLRHQVDELRGQLHAAPAASAPPPATAQLEQRVRAVEDDLQLTADKVDDQYQTKVESGSRYRVKLTGTLLFNVSGNAGHVEDTDLPRLALPSGPLDSHGNIGATIRQSQIGLQINGPELWGARSSADLFVDFFGGLAPTLDGATMGIARITVARGRLDWTNTSLVVGQDAPIMSPLSPTSLASLAVPALGYSGNLWTWTPQVRVEHRWSLPQDWKFAMQGGMMDPLSGQYPVSEYTRAAEAGEKSRVPAMATHNSFSRERNGRKLSLGFGGYYSRQYYAFGRNVDAWAATLDWNVPLGSRLEWSGEAYRGRALGGLWGATGRSLVSSGPLTDPAAQVAGLNDAGGWTQLKFHATRRLEFNAALGQDNPYGSDFRRFGTPLPYAFTTRNQTTMINFIQHLRSNLLLSLEYRHLNTSWAGAPAETADHVNAAVGVTF